MRVRRLGTALCVLLVAGCPTLDKTARVNTPPAIQVVVGPSAVVGRGAEVTLDASGTIDPDGRPLTLAWSQTAGEPVALSSTTTALVTFIAPDRPQTLVFQLEANDGARSSTAFTRVVVDFNTPPRAAAGPARETPNGSGVLLAGDASDVDGDEVVAWRWKVDAEPVVPGLEVASVLDGDATASPVFTPFAKGLYTLSLVVEDARGGVSSPATVVVRSLNTPPVARPGPALELANAEAVTLQGAADDRDPGETFEYRWTVEEVPATAPLPVTGGESSAGFTFTPRGKGLHVVSLSVSDGEAWSAPARVLLGVRNSPPVVTAGDRSTPNGEPVLLAPRTSDADGDAVVVDWEVLGAEGRRFELVRGAEDTTFTPFATGEWRLRATPYDGESVGTPVEVVVASHNRAPLGRVAGGPVLTTPRGTPLLVTSQSVDPDGDALTYRWTVTRAPAGTATFQLDGTDSGQATFTPSVRGEFELGLVVTDAGGLEGAPVVTRITSLNNAPVVTAPPLVAGFNRISQQIRAVATDPDVEPLTFAWLVESAPPGVPLPTLADADTDTVTVTPLARGTYTLAVTASDGLATSPPARVRLSVVGNVPTIAAEGREVPNNATVTLAADASDRDGDVPVIRWAMREAGGKPFTLAGGTGLPWTFTPRARGPYALVVTASDADGESPPLEVAVTSLNVAPVAVASSSLEAVTTGQRFHLTAAGSHDPDGPSGLTYAWTARQGSATFVEGSSGASVEVQAGGVKEALSFELVATDELGLASAPATVRVVVDNAVPVAVLPALDLPAGKVVVLDGGASFDAETPAGLLYYTWTSPSHPSLAFVPSRAVRAPTIQVPAVLGGQLELTLTVSDGRATSATAASTLAITPSDAVAIFVDAAATCGTGCDGTREKPFTGLTPAAALAEAGGGLKPVLVASGTYPSAAVGAGVSVTGGCDRERFRCDGASGPSILTALPSEATTLDVRRTATRVGTIRQLTIIGSTGAARGVDASLTALLCVGCRANFEDLVVDANGDAANVAGAHAFVVSATGGPVRVSRVTSTGGKSRYNTAFYVAGASDVVVEDSSLATVARIGTATNSANVVLMLTGSGQNVTFTRNQVTLHADTAVGEARFVNLYDSQHALFTSNFFWYRGAARTSRWVYILNQGNTHFIGNTFLGNDARNTNFDNIGFYVDCIRYVYCSTGTNLLINNYVENVRAFSDRDHALQPGSAPTLLLKNNTIWRADELNCLRSIHPAYGLDRSCSNDPATLNTGHGAPKPGGSANRVEDCRLVSPLNGNHHLGAGSPCVDSGLADPLAPALDLDGNARPSGAGHDRGADEVP